MDKALISHFIGSFSIACTYQKIILDANGMPYDYSFIHVNNAFEDMFKIKANNIMGKTLRTIPHIGHLKIENWIKMCAEAIRSKTSYDEAFYDLIPGKWLLSKVIPLNDDTFLIMFTDMENKFSNSLLITEFFTAHLDIVCVSSVDGKFVRVNKEFENVLGYNSEELKKKSFISLVHQEDVIETLKSINALEKQKSALNFLARYRCKDSSYCYIQWRAQSHGQYIYYSGRDITEEKKINQSLYHENKYLTKLASQLHEANTVLKHLAITDQLTGLNNRHCFEEKIIYEINQSDCYNTPLSMFIYDIDHFKNINDEFGHPIGDSVLKHLSSILNTIVPKTSIAFRIGGEEFILLMPNTTIENGKNIAEKLRAAFENTLHPIVGKITASFGVAERYKSETFKSWYKRVDDALYIAKNSGRNQVISYTPETSSIVAVQIEWNPEWNSGHRTIDTQHVELLELASKIFTSSYSKVTASDMMLHIESLLLHVKNHFRDEENLLNQLGFIGYSKHKKIHRNLLIQVEKLKSDYLDGKVNGTAFFSFILDEVIMNHTVGDDIEYFPLLQRSFTFPNNENLSL